MDLPEELRIETLALEGPPELTIRPLEYSRWSTTQRNFRGDVVFNGTLDTDANGDGIPDTGMFVWSKGALRLVARTGTVIPGVGTVTHLMNPYLVPPTPVAGPVSATSGAVINNRGQVFFQAILADGNDVLLVATPHDADHDADPD